MGMTISKRKVKSIYSPHPLQIDLVLDEVFANLGIRDLLICRQVCRNWEEISTPMLIRILHTAKPLDFYEALDPMEDLYLVECFKIDENEKRLFRKQNLGDYFRYLETSPKFIISVITIYFHYGKINFESDYLQKYLCKHGHSLQQLTLVWDKHLIGIENFSFFFQNLIFSQCKNLKRLELQNIPWVCIRSNFKEDGYNQPTKIQDLRIQHMKMEPKDVLNFARHILNYCPELEQLEWLDFEGWDHEFLLSLVKESKCFHTFKTVRMVERSGLWELHASRESMEEIPTEPPSFTNIHKISINFINTWHRNHLSC